MLPKVTTRTTTHTHTHRPGLTGLLYEMQIKPLRSTSLRVSDVLHDGASSSRVRVGAKKHLKIRPKRIGKIVVASIET